MSEIKDKIHKEIFGSLALLIEEYKNRMSPGEFFTAIQAALTSFAMNNHGDPEYVSKCLIITILEIEQIVKESRK
jgi:hypothetical protein